MAAAPSSPAIRNPQSAIRNPPSFAQQMVRSEPPSSQNTLLSRAGSAGPPSSEVLASFQIERTGQQVRIVDADGSAYEGQVVDAELFNRLQAANQANNLANKDMGVPPGAANTAQAKASGGNLQAQSNGYVDALANVGELPPRTANYDNTVQNQVSSPGANGLVFDLRQVPDQGSGFAFQVKGLNRKLNQNVTILGSCSNVPLLIGNFVNGGNVSNQSQALAGVNASMQNTVSASPARPPASQSQNILDNNGFTYRNFQNTQNTQNAAFPGQFWRVTGQVQIGPSNRFDLDAASAAP